MGMENRKGVLRQPLDLRNGFYYTHCITCEKRLTYAPLPRRCKRCLEAITPRVLEPTDSQPGSEEKIQVMAERASLGIPIFNRFDRILYDNPPEKSRAVCHRRFADPFVDE